MDRDDGITTAGSTRARLLSTAAALFRQFGYAGTTTRELAGHLGIQSASLYYHIGSKEDLLFALCTEALTHIQGEVARAMAEERTSLSRLHALIRAHVAAALADQDQHAAMLLELRSLGDARRAEVLALRDEYEYLVRDTVAGAQREGSLRNDLATKDLALALLNQLNWSIVWYRPGGDLTPERLAELLATVFLDGARPRPREGVKPTNGAAPDSRPKTENNPTHRRRTR